MFPYEDSKSVSVRPYPEKRNHPIFNISPTLVIDTSMERSSRVLQHYKLFIALYFFPLQKAKKPKKEVKPESINVLCKEEVWLPPSNQTGDGRTHLNEKFGY